MKSGFYDVLGEDYELMTDPESRISREKPFFDDLIREHRIESAVDIGCGTGHHVRLLAQSGVFTYGIDPEESFLHIAEKNLEGTSKNYKLAKGSIFDLEKLVDTKVDAVFCIGNTLPHILSENDLKKALLSVFKVLKKDGIFIIQVVNYSKVLDKKQRILKAGRSGNKTFVRFYDFEDPLIRFNILKLTETNGISHELISTDLYPWKSDEIKVLLLETGFTDLKIFGGYDQKAFKNSESASLVIIAAS
ncbi:MAG: class I SAM-dependent methyltransferase [bacterium]|nr:class I SAM-dependent methyltransferase [bacterium]